MQSSFVLVVGSAGEAIPGEVLDRLRHGRGPCPLIFEAAGQLLWSSRDGTTVVAAWCERAPEGLDDWAWHEDANGLCVVTSPLRRRHEPWPPAHRWAPLLGSVARPFTPTGLDQLTGEFSGLVLDPDGRGVVVTDAFANRGLYVGHMPTYAVVASSSRLAAAVMYGALDTAPLDPWGVSGLAYTKHRIGERTGFADVQSVPIGSYLEIADHIVSRRDRPPPWSPDRDEGGMDEAALIDRVQAVLEDEIVAASEIDANPRYVGLTGGKDSRLILALAITGGVADRFVYRTDGPSTLLDVEIASEIAQSVGVRWTNGALPNTTKPSDAASPRTWLDRMTSYIRETGGFCNIADTMGRTYARPENVDETEPIRLTGLSGELLRSMLGFEIPDERALVRRFDRHFGHLDLLRPEALHRYRTEWIEDLLTRSSDHASWNDLHDSFLLRTQVRTNCGPRLELSATRMVIPLSSLAAVRSVYAMGHVARVNELVHHRIVTRAAPALAQHRFTKGTWRTVRPAPSWAAPSGDRRFRRRRRGRRDLLAERLDRPPTASAVELDPALPASVHRERRTGYDAQIEVLRELVADRSNPAWDIIDPAAVAAAAGCYAQLPRAAHVELLGAATAALWLARA